MHTLPTFMCKSLMLNCLGCVGSYVNFEESK